MDNKLIPIGQVGTGFSEEEEELILKILDNLRIENSPFSIPFIPKKKVFYCKPEIVARVKFHEWTKDRKLRAPVFKGLRLDKSPEECEIEEGSNLKK